MVGRAETQVRRAQGEAGQNGNRSHARCDAVIDVFKDVYYIDITIAIFLYHWNMIFAWWSKVQTRYPRLLLKYCPHIRVLYSSVISIKCTNFVPLSKVGLVDNSGFGSRGHLRSSICAVKG